MRDEMTGAVNISREVLTYVEIEVLFENAEINREDQYRTSLSA